MNDLAYYWDTLPIGRKNAITYGQLCELWGVKSRKVRAILHDLSGWDNNDDYILIRSSKNRGFYLSDDKTEIEQYKQECMNRAKRTFAPMKKINRIQAHCNQVSLFDSALKFARESAGFSQVTVCNYLKHNGEMIDPPTLSRYENHICIPTTRQTLLLAKLYDVDPFMFIMDI